MKSKKELYKIHQKKSIIKYYMILTILKKTIQKKKEYMIMELLSLRKGATLNKEQFLNHLYGGIDEPELKIIDVFICKLRKKLEKASGGKNYIETVWGRGYILKDPDEKK